MGNLKTSSNSARNGMETGREAISIDQQRWIVVGPQRRKKYIVEALNNLRDKEDEDEDDMEVKQFENVLVCGGI